MGDLGITFLLREHRKAGGAEFAINQGGGGEFDSKSGKYQQFQTGTAEKTPPRPKLLARGRAGDGLVPTKDNAVGVLARAVARLFDHPLPPRLNETTHTYFERLADSAPPKQPASYRAILEPNPSEEAQENYAG